ncbi:MAG: NINE protein [Saprospiraceae bacterium]
MGKRSRQGGVKYRNRREDGPAARRKMGIVFAITLGWCGVHRFIMGQWQWGLAHIFMFVATMAIFDGEMTPWTTLSAFVAYYTAFRWWRMSNEEFADEYLEPVEEEVGGKYLKGTSTAHPKVISGKARRKILASAKTLYEQFDYQGAAELYEDALDMDLADGDSRVLAARCYSLLEDAEASYRHLRRAVLLKANNLDIITKDEGFAWLRMQVDYVRRRRAGYAPVEPIVEKATAPPALPPRQDNILERLEKLGELKERGLLDDDEFLREKKRLLR